MDRRSAAPLLALALAVACEAPITAPDSITPSNAAPLLQEGLRDQRCVGFVEGTFHNVIVPPGETCFLVRSTVSGNVRALMGSSLTMVDGAIGGNVDAHKASFVWLRESVVSGDVTIADGVGNAEESPNFFVDRLTLTHGNLNVVNNTGMISLRDNNLVEGSINAEGNVLGNLFVGRNIVARDIRVVNNGPGGTTVRANTAGGTIHCEGNASLAAMLNEAPVLSGQCAASDTPQ